MHKYSHVRDKYGVGRRIEGKVGNIRKSSSKYYIYHITFSIDLPFDTNPPTSFQTHPYLTPAHRIPLENTEVYNGYYSWYHPNPISVVVLPMFQEGGYRSQYTPLCIQPPDWTLE